MHYFRNSQTVIKDLTISGNTVSKLQSENFVAMPY